MQLKLLITTLITLMALNTKAQITGFVINDQTGDTIAFATAAYKGHNTSVSANERGFYNIQRHNGWSLTFSAVGFHSKRININANTPAKLNVRLKPDTRQLEEVEVRHKRVRYSRKDNPAVELMKRVIAAKKRTHLENHDFYQYQKYQKITFGVNDVTSKDLESKFFQKHPWLINQVEPCLKNNKLILPITVDETVTQHIYRKEPKKEKDFIIGQKTEGISNVIQTGEILSMMMKELFRDIDIYDDFITVLQHPFPSPIGRTAISFYRFYIEDTLLVDNDSCYHLQFIPNNQQDFGFRGELFVLKDSTLHVKKCNMQIPKRTDVNFIGNMFMEQEYSKLPNGEWALTTDDLFAELKVSEFITNGFLNRTTRLSDYSFEEIAQKQFKGKAPIKELPDARMQGNDFWEKNRKADLTKSEADMPNFIKRMEQSKNYKWVLAGARLLLENYIETGKDSADSKFDIGPVNTFISHNFVDHYRLRASGRTTANLNPHLFWNGFYAYGTHSRKHYYGTEFTYSFNKKKYQPFEFPQRTIAVESTFDVMSPADKFINHNKDNAFMAFRTQKVEQMYFYNRQKISFVYETDWGLGVNTAFKAESNKPTGTLVFERVGDGKIINRIRTTEVTFGLAYSPNITFVNTKQRRMMVNHNSPEIAVNHTVGLNRIMGGQYKLNFTEVDIFNRVWLGSWGYINMRLKGGAQWNKVPFPLLIMPPVNLSFFENDKSFSLMRNMEFLNDRYAYVSFAWDTQGKLLNRVPFVRHLKWREYFALKAMWGTLTDKNNPLKESNATSDMLFRMPEGAHVMNNKKPYVEAVVGIHNILRLFAIDFVHRFSYNELPNTSKNGIRFGFELTF
ncbi:MAG: carboxypeptidase-like regulatory domain-containing protein [Prevotella sp.]|nr:carboxypeptidase-like regulatory domain-containing protein [Prevotella sp.]